ncbi:MAG: NAD-dependent epimerase/dehydratase family protein [Saprospirales bacterium]|nr:NAD-dependent epimerase/dehydratase family protein [Saprospirales bacterium]
MTTVFVSGATGYIGEQLSKKLAEHGNAVRALVRNPHKTNRLQHPNIRAVEGSLADPISLAAGMEGCAVAYHIAALAGVWHPDPEAFRKVNVQGTLQVLRAAHAVGVRRVVVTSTAGVMGATPDGREVDERTNPIPDLTTAYEQSKLEAEGQIWEFGASTGLEVVVVNPSRVYGPGQWSVSNGVTKMIRGYAAGTWRLIPGDGRSIGNYVFIDDVVTGHILAMEKGRPGERYILGGENYSYNDFFALLACITGRRHTMLRLPLPAMMAFAHTQQFLADRFGRPPMITPPFVRKFVRNWPLSSRKAEAELGYHITPLEEGMRKTLEWLGKV